MRTFLPQITDYPAFLNEAWQQHLASRMASAPTIISTFAGCGGSSLGYSMAGYKELLAVEWDNNAVQTFKLNFPGIPVYHGDIAKLSIDECMKKAGLTEPGQLDVLDGSPPCQGFSTAGNRNFNDDRNQLFHEYVRLLHGLQPKVFVMENVSGMIKGKMKLIFAEILRKLRDSGYLVSARLLNAKWFGVPQSRERLIFIGTRKELKITPSHPIAKNSPIAADKAILGALTSDCGNPRGVFVLKMRRVKPGSNVARTDNCNSYFSYARCPIGKPCMTLQKSVSFGGITIFHPMENRNCSKEELRRISSFPDEFLFHGNYENAVNLMGNSVPPLFMRAIALHIKDNILQQFQNS